MVDIDFTLQIASKKKSNGFKSEEIGGHLTSLLGYPGNFYVGWR